MNPRIPPVLRPHLEKVRAFLSVPRNVLLLSAAIFLVPFLGSRAYFFLDYPIPALYPDSTSYYVLVQEMHAGRLPDFSQRPPLYPLFLAAVYAVSDRVIAVLIAQNLIAAASALLLVWAVFRVRPLLAPGAAAAMAAYSIGTWPIEHDTALLSESLYVSLLVASAAALLLALVTRQTLANVAASLAFALTILTRPAGAFLLVIWLLVIAFLVWNRASLRTRLAFAIPLPAMLFLLSGYNALRMGAATPSAFAESQIAFATLTFWETDPEYPAEVNDAITRAKAVLDQTITADERHALETSWNPRKLWDPFLKGYSYAALGEASRHGDGPQDYLAVRAWLRTVSIDAIKKNPGMYAKFVYTQLAFYFTNISREYDFTDLLKNRAVEVYAKRGWSSERGNAFMTELAKEYADADPPPAVKVTGTGEGATVEMTSRSIAEWVHRRLTGVRQTFLARRIWVALFFASLFWSAVRLAQTRARDPGVTFVFLLNLGVIGASLIVALVEVGGVRYSYPTEFVYYLDAALWPILLRAPAPTPPPSPSPTTT